MSSASRCPSRNRIRGLAALPVIPPPKKMVVRGHAVTRPIVCSGTHLKMQDDVLSSFRKALASSKNIIIVSGAGLSAASGTHGSLFPSWLLMLQCFSGIPTYRGQNGLWLDFVSIYPVSSLPSKWLQDQTKLAKPEAFKEDPSRVWQFYHARRQLQVLQARV